MLTHPHAEPLPPVAQLPSEADHRFLHAFFDGTLDFQQLAKAFGLSMLDLVNWCHRPDVATALKLTNQAIEERNASLAAYAAPAAIRALHQIIESCRAEAADPEIAGDPEFADHLRRSRDSACRAASLLKRFIALAPQPASHPSTPARTIQHQPHSSARPAATPSVAPPAAAPPTKSPALKSTSPMSQQPPQHQRPQPAQAPRSPQPPDLHQSQLAAPC